MLWVTKHTLCWRYQRDANRQSQSSGEPVWGPWLVLAEDITLFPKDAKELSVCQCPGPTSRAHKVWEGAWLPVLQGLNKTVH